MAYTASLTAALTGATESQLRYWRQTRKGQPPLLAPQYQTRPSALYSYRDIVTLRMFVQLRNKLSLQKVRRAVAYVEDQLPLGAHISEEQIKALPGGKSAVWISKDGDFVDAVARPGQLGIQVVMEDVFRSFTTGRGQEVPDLARPALGLVIDPEVRGGNPVAEGTRVTFDLIADLRRDGLSVDRVRQLYPAVSEDSIKGAVDFSERVHSLQAA